MGLIFDGVDLETEYGVVVSGAGSWAKPERDRELVHVPGRNGDLIYDNGCWRNIEIPYSLFFRDGWSTEYEAFCGWLCSHVGYYRLEDTDRHPGVYRMAEFAGPLDPKKWLLSDDGVVTVVFNCKPQQWLLSGEEPIELETSPFVRGYIGEDRVWHNNVENGLATPLLGAHQVRLARIEVKNNRSTSVDVIMGYGEQSSPGDALFDALTHSPTIAAGESSYLTFSNENPLPYYCRLSAYSNSGFAGLEISVFMIFFDETELTYDLSQYLVGKSIVNETQYEALPIIMVGKHADGYFHINNFSLTVSGYNLNEDIVIDCEREDCYSQNTFKNVNRYVSIENDNEKELRDFPYLAPGNNILGPYQVGELATIFFDQENSRTVKVIPNWYKI